MRTENSVLYFFQRDSLEKGDIIIFVTTYMESIKMEQEPEKIQLNLIDLINAAKIMEAAVARNSFKVEELVDVAPVVSKFVEFANSALEDIKAQEEADAAQAAAEQNKGE